MGKDVHLVNIYLKIHNKRPLTMDDLEYLAKYDPECFAKTCENVVYNIPESKPIMEVKTEEATSAKQEIVVSSRKHIDEILKNIKRLEKKSYPVSNVDAGKVKDLLGNLYMELLFPHNDKETFIGMPKEEDIFKFDKKI